MNELNPELDSQLRNLAELCCDVLKRREVDSSERAKPLLQALVTGGYDRISDVNLQTRLEDMAADMCRETAIHRRQELTGIVSQMQSTFNDMARWQTKSPFDPSGTKGANISSNTDA